MHMCMLEHTINWKCHTEYVNKAEAMTLTGCDPCKETVFMLLRDISFICPSQ